MGAGTNSKIKGTESITPRWHSPKLILKEMSEYIKKQAKK